MTNNKMEGLGTMTWSDKRKYVGMFKNDNRNGWGIIEWPDGKQYEGQWSDGKQHGIGKLIRKRKIRYNKWANGIK